MGRPATRDTKVVRPLTLTVMLCAVPGVGVTLNCTRVSPQCRVVEVCISTNWNVCDPMRWGFPEGESRVASGSIIISALALGLGGVVDGAMVAGAGVGAGAIGGPIWVGACKGSGRRLEMCGAFIAICSALANSSPSMGRSACR